MDEFMRLWSETNELMVQRPYPSTKIHENQERMRRLLAESAPDSTVLMVPLKSEG